MDLLIREQVRSFINFTVSSLKKITWKGICNGINAIEEKTNNAHIIPLRKLSKTGLDA
ncbi:MAG: hypothetical protein GX119_05170 [Syntrophomonadaceae bacterium]|nr:hypothetical protein [Syntrophomonadaceae bacterium]